jgi:hypothetical protein
MRRIVESTLVSLDGVFGDPHLWAAEYFDDETEAHALELLSAANAVARTTRSRSLDMLRKHTRCASCIEHLRGREAHELDGYW